MPVDPWTSPDPQPGDFDAELAGLDPSLIDRFQGDPSAKVRVLVSVEGEDAERLERLSEASGKGPADVVADLLRDAEQSAA